MNGSANHYLFQKEKQDLMKFQVEKVIIGSDHGGFALKQAVIAHLKENGIQV